MRTETSKSTKIQKLSEQLAMFDHLPNCAQVPITIVCAIKGRSPASIWRDVAAGRIAKPVNAGPHCTRWRVGDLRHETQRKSPLPNNNVEARNDN